MLYSRRWWQLSPPFLRCFLSDLFKLADNEDRHKISNKFECRPHRTIPYRVGALEHLRISHRLITRKWCLQASLFFVKLAGNQDRHKISDKFEFRLDLISHFGVTHPWGQIKFSIDLLWKLQVLIKFYMYHQWDGRKAAFRFWSRFHQSCGCHGNRKLQLTYNGENDVSMLKPSVLIRSSNLQVTKIGIKPPTFEFRPDQTTPLS